MTGPVQEPEVEKVGRFLDASEDVETAALLRAWREARDTEEEAKKLKEQLAPRVRKAMAGFTFGVIDGEKIVEFSRPGKSFSAEKAAEVLPPQVVELITVTTTAIDPAKAKELLPTSLYELCLVTGRAGSLKKPK